MPRGPKKHLKRLAAPKSWMLGKLGGVFTVKPSSGPHKQSEALPISLFLRWDAVMIAMAMVIGFCDEHLLGYKRSLRRDEYCLLDSI